ncbi:RidA family protein [Streptomyces sp. NP160]|uniref:RidA family protein n=1 Tax=Streptomyces sp. NP160 TaxID=2586637 RepID=UPI001119F16B|nr:RidA family protein [Streptomyces sp. NP160]TNM68548.1 RidA family protein [Streptomyces sp. NP160]
MTSPFGPVRLLRSGQLTPSVPYAYAAATDRPGRLLFTAGACPLDEECRVVAPGDHVAQAEQVLANLRTVLREAGTDLTDVVKTTVYVASDRREVLGEVWDVVARTFGEHDAPSTLLGVAALGWPDQLVEVEAVAVLP